MDFNITTDKSHWLNIWNIQNNSYNNKKTKNLISKLAEDLKTRFQRRPANVRHARGNEKGLPPWDDSWDDSDWSHETPLHSLENGSNRKIRNQVLVRTRDAGSRRHHGRNIRWCTVLQEGKRRAPAWAAVPSPNTQETRTHIHKISYTRDPSSTVRDSQRGHAPRIPSAWEHTTETRAVVRGIERWGELQHGWRENTGRRVEAARPRRLQSIRSCWYEMPTVSKPAETGSRSTAVRGRGSGRGVSANGDFLSGRDQTVWNWWGQLYNLVNILKAMKLIPWNHGIKIVNFLMWILSQIFFKLVIVSNPISCFNLWETTTRQVLV